MVTSTYRVDAELKQQAAELYESLGMSLNTAINVFLRQSVREQRMPFRPGVTILPEPGTAADNGVIYRGMDERGYPVVTIPDALVTQPRRDTDGTPVLPDSWKD